MSLERASSLKTLKSQPKERIFNRNEVLYNYDAWVFNHMPQIRELLKSVAVFCLENDLNLWFPEGVELTIHQIINDEFSNELLFSNRKNGPSINFIKSESSLQLKRTKGYHVLSPNDFSDEHYVGPVSQEVCDLLRCTIIIPPNKYDLMELARLSLELATVLNQKHGLILFNTLESLSTLKASGYSHVAIDMVDPKNALPIEIKINSLECTEACVLEHKIYDTRNRIWNNIRLEILKLGGKSPVGIKEISEFDNMIKEMKRKESMYADQGDSYKKQLFIYYFTTVYSLAYECLYNNIHEFIEWLISGKNSDFQDKFVEKLNDIYQMFLSYYGVKEYGDSIMNNPNGVINSEEDRRKYAKAISELLDEYKLSLRPGPNEEISQIVAVNRGR